MYSACKNRFLRPGCILLFVDSDNIADYRKTDFHGFKTTVTLKGTLTSSSPMLSWYPWVPIYYMMEMLLDPNILYYGNILGPSSAILWGCPWIFKSYILGVPWGPQVLYDGGTPGSSRPIFRGYPWVLRKYITDVFLGLQVLL
ncbi:unnamed protein product [Adineta ricciae]|uniref:Uncharacterized protein n=1 Tax=Adineta ricciae TaxID=249248 RepID=A0A815NQA0_ADIRI|nr:unnamed protein product [Adineta ricciae]